MKTFNEFVEGYVSDAQRKAVHAAKADGGKGHPDKKKKSKINEGKKRSAQNEKILRVIGSAQNMDQAIQMVMKSHSADEKKAKMLVHRAVKSAFYGEAVVNEGEAEKRAKVRISRELKNDKRRHDRMLDSARLQDAQTKNKTTQVK